MMNMLLDEACIVNMRFFLCMHAHISECSEVLWLCIRCIRPTTHVAQNQSNWRSLL